MRTRSYARVALTSQRWGTSIPTAMVLLPSQAGRSCAPVYLQPRPISIAIAAEFADPGRCSLGTIRMATRVHDPSNAGWWSLLGLAEAAPSTFALLMNVPWEDQRVYLAVAPLEDGVGGLDLMVAVYAPTHLLPWFREFDAGYFFHPGSQAPNESEQGTPELPSMPPFSFRDDLLHADVMPSTLVQANGNQFGMLPVGAVRCAASDRRCGESVGEEIERIIGAVLTGVNVTVEGAALRVR